jgi:hypothetical protein
MVGPTKNFQGSSSLCNTGRPSLLFVQKRKVQAEDILRSLFSFSPHDLDRGGAQDEVIWMELEEASIYGARRGDEQL